MPEKLLVSLWIHLVVNIEVPILEHARLKSIIQDVIQDLNPLCISKWISHLFELPFLKFIFDFFFKQIYIRYVARRLKKLNFKELSLKWTIETVIMRPSGSWVINYDVSWSSKIATIFWSSGVDRFTNVISKCLHQWPT